MLPSPSINPAISAKVRDLSKFKIDIGGLYVFEGFISNLLHISITVSISLHLTDSDKSDFPYDPVYSI